MQSVGYGRFSWDVMMERKEGQGTELCAERAGLAREEGWEEQVARSGRMEKLGKGALRGSMRGGCGAKVVAL